MANGSKSKVKEIRASPCGPRGNSWGEQLTRKVAGRIVCHGFCIYSVVENEIDCFDIR